MSNTNFLLAPATPFPGLVSADPLVLVTRDPGPAHFLYYQTFPLTRSRNPPALEIPHNQGSGALRKGVPVPA